MISKEQKTDVIQSYRRHDSDTGSAEVQVAVLSTRITQLTDHLKANKSDFSSRRGLLKLVGRRRRLLQYLRSCDLKGYSALIARLGLRK